jgi:elongation factor P
MNTFEAGSLKRGQRVELDGDPCEAVDIHLQTPSARGAQVIVRAKLHNLRTGQMVDRTFRGTDKLQEPDFELRPVQYLYRQGDELQFMDTETYDQFALSAEDVGDGAGYLTEGATCKSMVHNGRVLGIEPPPIVELKIVETAPVLAGATAKAQAKPATLETGVVVQVPAYMEAGETVRVDTRENRFIDRVRKSG